jgi:hypothetical protein
MYTAGNPVMLVDPDGMRVTGGKKGMNPDLEENTNGSSNTNHGNGSYRHSETTTQNSSPQTAKRNLPSFSKLESNYPKYGPQYSNGGVSDLEFAKLAGGKVQYNIELFYKSGGSNGFGNTCALRVSYALTESGESLPKVPGPGNSSSDRNGKWLYPKVATLIKQLSLIYGSPKIVNSSNINDFKGLKGIIVFHTGDMYSDATGHATLWDGNNALGGNHNYIPLMGNGVSASLWITN